MQPLSGAEAERHPVEISTGMNFRNGTQWTPSDPTFTVTRGGFMATNIQHKIHISSQLNLSHAVLALSPDGIPIQSTPVAIRLFDAASGSAAIIGLLTNSTGALVTDNQVLFPDAFSGICADVLYTLQKGTFEQDVVFR